MGRVYRGNLISTYQPVVEERTVVLQGLAQVFGGDDIALFPPALQRSTLVGKRAGDFLDHIRDKLIRLLDGRTGFIYKLALDIVPACVQIL